MRREYLLKEDSTHIQVQLRDKSHKYYTDAVSQ